MVQNDVVGVEGGIFAVSVAGVLGAAGVGSAVEGHGAVVVYCGLAVAGVVDRALSADGQVAAGVDGKGVAGALGGRVVGDGQPAERGTRAGAGELLDSPGAGGVRVGGRAGVAAGMGTAGGAGGDRALRGGLPVAGSGAGGQAADGGVGVVGGVWRQG